MRDRFFRPFDGLHSPVSTDEIRSLVLRRAVRSTLGSQVRGLVTQFLITGTASALILTAFSSSIEYQDRLVAIRLVAPVSVQTSLSLANIPPIAARSAPHDRSFPILEQPAQTPALSITPVTARDIPSPVEFGATGFGISSILSAETRNPIPDIRPASLHPFVSAGAGAFFGRFRSVGENVSVGVRDASAFLQLALLNASGGRDPRDLQKILLQHSTSEEATRWSESNRQIALMGGMTSRIFNFDASVAIGPSYLFSTITSIDPTSGTIGTPQYRQQFGASAEASLTYSIFQNLQTGLSGAMNYHGWGSNGTVSGAVLMSVRFKLL